MMIVRIHFSNLTKAVQKNCVQQIIANMIMAGIGPLWIGGMSMEGDFWVSQYLSGLDTSFPL